MGYLIDGHNLIPKLGISLRAMDDENTLIGLLQVFCRVRRKSVDVYFDNTPPPFAGIRRRGQVTVHYVRQGMIADDAISEHLGRLGKAAKNYTVVSSDRQVQARAREVHAVVQTSEAFAREVQSARYEAPPAPGEPDADLDEFKKMFGVKD